MEGGKIAGADNDTAVGDIVIINVSSDGPYGVIFEPDQDGCAAVIQAWERLPNGKFGELQKHGGLHHSDVLIAVNDIKLDCVPYQEVIRIVNDRNLLKKTFKFMNSAEYYRRKKVTGGISLTLQNDKNSFLSIIRRARISQLSSNKFVEYEIACQWRVASMRLQKEIIHKWSVWKRFSEFSVLHNLLKKSLGWQMQSIEMPSEHTFVINKLTPEFIEQRKEDLNAYWQKIITIDKVVEFNKHHCSQDVKSFLQVDETVRNQKNGITDNDNDNDDDNIKDDSNSNNNKANRRGSTGSVRAPPRGLASRRRSSATNSGVAAFGTDNQPSKATTNSISEIITSSSSSSTTTTATTTISSNMENNNNLTKSRAPPPPPPPPPKNQPPPPPPQNTPSSESGPPVPKPNGARLNLLADIAKRRID